MTTSYSADPDRFLFRGLYPGLHLGTASDRYAGWVGQVYSQGRYAPVSRAKRLAGKTFQELVLPVESVSEYFRHFDVLEVDFTFYSLLLDQDHRPSRAYNALKVYMDNLPDDARLILKAPQAVFARKLRRGNSFVTNPDYLDSRMLTLRFLEPAKELLGACLAGVVFEQEYQRKQDRSEPEQFASELDAFFEGCPGDHCYHVEIRTAQYLAPSLFKVLEKRGVGQVLSHWTWLPSLWDQLRKAGGRFFNEGGDCVVRLMTPRGVRYEEAYGMAFPFDRMVEGMMSPGMIEDAVRVTIAALEQNVRVNMVVNNRAGGNAPLIAGKFAESFLRRISVEA